MMMVLKKIIWLDTFALFANFKAKRTGKVLKHEIVFYEHILNFILAPISTLTFSIFLINSGIIVPY